MTEVLVGRSEAAGLSGTGGLECERSPTFWGEPAPLLVQGAVAVGAAQREVREARLGLTDLR
jgi:hypothetical protein